MSLNFLFGKTGIIMLLAHRLAVRMKQSNLLSALQRCPHPVRAQDRFPVTFVIITLEPQKEIPV